jgi:hypothetical protein
MGCGDKVKGFSIREKGSKMNVNTRDEGNLRTKKLGMYMYMEDASSVAQYKYCTRKHHDGPRNGSHKN